MNNQEIQQNLTRLGLLDPPSDGQFGRQSKLALTSFQREYGLEPTGAFNANTALKLSKARFEFDLGNDFASSIVKYCLRQKFFVPRTTGSDRRIFIVYVEGTDPNGKLNGDKPNEFNDASLQIEVINGKPKIIFAADGTVEPGDKYTIYPMNPDGAFRIKNPSQFKAWRVGYHGTNDVHEALIQVAPIQGYRDKNKDYIRTGDQLVEGLFFVNQHWGYDFSRDNVGETSAGCLLRRKRSDHRAWMRNNKLDCRYLLDPNYTYLTAVIPGDELVKLFPYS